MDLENKVNKEHKNIFSRIRKSKLAKSSFLSAGILAGIISCARTKDYPTERAIIIEFIGPISTVTSNKAFPSLYDTKIVWQDNRNGNDNHDIYMYDLATKQEIQITTNTAHQHNPFIHGNKMVWGDKRNGNLDIFMYDLGPDGIYGTGDDTGEVQITTNTADQRLPKIHKDKIVWEDYRNGNRDIYMYDTTSGTETPITTNTADQRFPDIYQDKIVWQDLRNGNWDIYMYDLVSNKEIQITINISSQEGPHIYENKIIYADKRNGNADVYMYDLSIGIETQITSNIADQGMDCRWWGCISFSSIAIYQDKIVYQDNRNGNWDIYMYDLFTGQEIQITSDLRDQKYPSIHQSRIVWQDHRNNDSEIYIYMKKQIKF